MDIHNWYIDIHKLIMDIHNSIMDIHDWIMDIPQSIMDIHDWIIDTHKIELWISIIRPIYGYP